MKTKRFFRYGFLVCTAAVLCAAGCGNPFLRKMFNRGGEDESHEPSVSEVLLPPGAPALPWGCNSTVAASNNKVVMGPGSSSGTQILIVDTVTGAVSVKPDIPLSSTTWGSYSTVAASNNKVVMGRGTNSSNKILIVDTTGAGSANEFPPAPLPSKYWGSGNSIAVTGNGK
ncbi:MAG: hypothetical protein LBD09_01090, partial [Treponema sp.]|nr:hypothetical protein [Treponema sp.]